MSVRTGEYEALVVKRWERAYSGGSDSCSTHQLGDRRDSLLMRCRGDNIFSLLLTTSPSLFPKGDDTEAGVTAGGRPEEPAGRDTEPGRTTRNSGNLEHTQRSVTPPLLRFLSSGARS
ncbi:unnamed protein product [Gadus morhua 'NCC']